MFVRFASFFSFVVIVFAVVSAIQNIKADDAPVQKTNNDYVNSDKSGSYYISKERAAIVREQRTVDEEKSEFVPTPTPSPSGTPDIRRGFSKYIDEETETNDNEYGFSKHDVQPTKKPTPYFNSDNIDIDSSYSQEPVTSPKSSFPQKTPKPYVDSSFGTSSAIDRDIDNDGLWDFGNGGVDRDTDNDGMWDYNKGGVDRDADNDGLWDFGNGGVDRDTDNDGLWDYNKGGVDRDADNDGLWDAGNGGVDRDLDNDGLWDR